MGKADDDICASSLAKVCDAGHIQSQLLFYRRRSLASADCLVQQQLSTFWTVHGSGLNGLFFKKR
jgi:hypothetical protein